jgi:hypothetical protein
LYRTIRTSSIKVSRAFEQRIDVDLKENKVMTIHRHHGDHHDCQLEAQWAEPVSLTFHSALRKLNTEPSFGHLAKQFFIKIANLVSIR